MKPQEIRAGDRFSHRGVLYEAIADAEATRYANYEIVSRRLTPERVVFDYTNEIDVDRPAASNDQQPPA